MKKLVLLFAALAATLTLGLSSASAITDGVPDLNGHPYVGLMVAQDANGTPLWRCSGTLLSATVFLTAGHCTDGAAHIEIWFDDGYPIPIGNPGNDVPDYPFVGDVGGTPHTIPGYAFPTRDLGLVTLSSPWAVGTYGQLPTAGQLDALKKKRGQQDQTFTSVGYGLQKAFPDAVSYKDSALRTRMVANPHLIQINTGIAGDDSLLLSNNAATGGLCFGDSGGPNFLGNSTVIAGTSDYVINGNCAGTGGFFRLDKQDLIDWINLYL